MNNHHPLSDERLEEQLRALPEIDPPAGLTDRVMAQVLAAEEPWASPAAARRAAGRATPWASPWQVIAALVLLTAAAVPLLVRSWPELVLLAGRVGLALFEGVRLAMDGLQMVITFGVAFVSRAGIVLSAFAKATSTVMEAVTAQAGSLMVLIVAVALVLQLVLLTIVRRRTDAV